MNLITQTNIKLDRKYHLKKKGIKMVTTEFKRLMAQAAKIR